jgi:hypothetical protein
MPHSGPFFDRVKESMENRNDFSRITEFSNYWVNQEGVIIGPYGKRLKERPTVPSKKGNLPYLQVALYRDNIRFDLFVHKIVLETFVGKCPDGYEARHLNSNCKDNRLENLCWGTKEENTQDRILIRTHCKNCGLPLQGHNLLVVNTGPSKKARKCRRCHNERALARYHRKKGLSKLKELD